MRNLRIFLIVTGRLLKRNQKRIFFLLLLIVAIFFSLSFFKKYFIRNSITQGMVGTFTENDLPEAVTNLLSDGLMSLDKSGTPQPNLIKEWKVDENAKNYIFKIKDNLYWSDGSKVKASDLSFSIKDAQITSTDDLTLNFKLADSFSPLPTLLTKPILKKNSFIGVGPYFVYSIEKNQIFISKMVLRSKETDLPEVIIKFYPNEKIAKQALKLGEIQSLINVSNFKDLQDMSPFKVISLINYSKLVAIFYNTKDKILSDKNLRLALSFASPSINGEREAKTSLSPSSWAYNSDVKDYLDNPEKAEEYLAKVEKSGKKITLTATANLKEVGEMIIKEWNKQGIKAVLRVESGIPQNFQALLISQNIPTDPDQYSLWHSTQKASNISQYSSARIDKDLEDGRKATKLDVRKMRYLDFQKELLDDAPATFLYFSKLNIIYLKKIDSSLRKVIELQFPNLSSS